MSWSCRVVSSRPILNINNQQHRARKGIIHPSINHAEPNRIHRTAATTIIMHKSPPHLRLTERRRGTSTGWGTTLSDPAAAPAAADARPKKKPMEPSSPSRSSGPPGTDRLCRRMPLFCCGCDDRVNL